MACNLFQYPYAGTPSSSSSSLLLPSPLPLSSSLSSVGVDTSHNSNTKHRTTLTAIRLGEDRPWNPLDLVSRRRTGTGTGDTPSSSSSRSSSLTTTSTTPIPSIPTLSCTLLMILKQLTKANFLTHRLVPPAVADERRIAARRRHAHGSLDESITNPNASDAASKSNSQGAKSKEIKPHYGKSSGVYSFFGLGVGAGVFAFGVGYGAGYGIGIGYGKGAPFNFPLFSFGPMIGPMVGFGIGVGRITGVDFLDPAIDWEEVVMGSKSWGVDRKKNRKNRNAKLPAKSG